MNRNTYRVMGFDISKSSPGYSYIEVENGNLVEIETGVIDVNNRGKITKEYFIYFELLREEIEKLIYSKLRGVGVIRNNCHIVFESSVFHHQQSELLYFLNQSLLISAKKAGINTIGLPPSRLKMLIRSLSSEKCGKDINKKQINTIYKKYIYSKFKSVKGVVENIKTDDEVDALFLALFGMEFFSKTLNIPKNINTLDDIKKYLLLEDDGLSRQMYKNKMGVLVFPKTTKNKSVDKILKDNSFVPLSIQSNYFYPFYFEEMLLCILKDSYSNENIRRELAGVLGIDINKLKDSNVLDAFIHTSVQYITLNKRGKFLAI